MNLPASVKLSLQEGDATNEVILSIAKLLNCAYKISNLPSLTTMLVPRVLKCEEIENTCAKTTPQTRVIHH